MTFPGTDYPPTTIVGADQKVVAFLGDSIFDTGFTSTLPPVVGATQQFLNIAPPGWIRFLTSQRCHTGQANNFAHSGDTLSQIAVRVPALIASAPDIVCINGGTNDLAASATFIDMRNTMLNSILLPILTAGIDCIVTPISPRPVSGIPAGWMQIWQRYNNWLRKLCRSHNLPFTNTGFSVPRRGKLYLADVTKYWSNFADANGDPLANFLRDTVHPNAQGAYWYGRVFADIINQIVPPGDYQQEHNGDYWNANNPSGNLLRSGSTNQGTLAGTGGTFTASTGFTSGGTAIAAGWTFKRLAGTSTMVATTTKENPRTDGPNSGERQVIALAASSTGTNDEQYQFRFTSTFSIPVGDIKNGDIIQGGMSFELDSHVGLTAAELSISEFGGAVNQTSIDMARHAQSGIMPNSPAPPFPISGVLRSEPITIQADSTGLTFSLVLHFDATAVNPAAVVKLADAWLRKVTD